MDNFKDMSVKINTVTKQLPKYSRTTEEIIPFLDVGSRDKTNVSSEKEKYLRGGSRQTLFHHGSY
jgi:hypothetical protein